jgi:hypothetical protein
LVLAAGCSSFTEVSVDSAPDATDFGTDPDLEVDQAQPDAPPPIINDFECTEAWTVQDKAEPTCAPRTVEVIATGVVDPSAVAITGAASGRIGILYNTMLWADEGHLIVVTKDGGPPQSITIQEGIGERVGVAAKIAADSTGTLHLAYLTHSDSSDAVYYQHLSAGGQLYPKEPVIVDAAGVEQVGLAVAPGGEAHVLYYDALQGELLARRRDVAGDWSKPIYVKSGFGSGVPGAGQVDVVMDSRDVPHAAYHYVITALHSNPNYSAFGATSWNMPKTVDNATPSGISGWSPSLALHGNEHLVTYFTIRDTTAELRLARWIAADAIPQVNVLTSVQGVDPATPSFRSAMAVDSLGYVHLAVLLRRTEYEARLEYWRQYPRGDEVVWLRDTVDPSAVKPGVVPLVDLHMDGQDRPHIVYYNSENGKVLYATRDSRL